MLSNQTLEILKSLDKQELKRFGDFIRSPYFNSVSALEVVYETVVKAAPEFNSPALSFSKMFKKLYPSKEYKEQTVKNLYSEFGNLLKKFLGQENLASKSMDFDFYVCEALTDKNLNAISNKIIKKSLRENDDGLLSAANLFHTLHRLQYTRAHNMDFLREQGSAEYLEAHIFKQEMLLIFFFNNFFEMCITASINKKLFDWKKNKLEEFFEAFDINKVLNYFEKYIPGYTSYIKCLYLLYYYTENEITTQQYGELKTALLETIHRLRKNDQHVFISRLIQIILAKLVPVDRRTYYREIFDLSKLFCELKIFPNDVLKNLAIGPFRDMFTVAVILKEYDWVENFVKEYSQYLNDELRENELNYCLGVLSFKKGNYEDSLNHFNKLQLQDIIEKINVRFYYMMNYIELKAYESALTSLNTIRQFYTDRSEEIPEMFAVLIPNALKYFSIVIKSEEKGEKLEEFMLEEAKQCGRFYHIKYVLDKMKSLM